MAAGQGRRVPLVVYGHMHSQLKGGGLRNRVSACSESGIVYLNAAVVPRVRRVPVAAVAEALQAAGSCGAAAAAEPVTVHHFVEVVLRGGEVAGAADVWVGRLPSGSSSGSNSSSNGSGMGEWRVLQRHLLLRSAVADSEDDSGSDGGGSSGNSTTEKRLVSCWHAHTGEWLPVVLPRWRPERQLQET